MKALLAATAALALLGACTKPTPICDRETQEWSKFGTQEDVCVTPPRVVAAKHIDWPHDDDDRAGRPVDVSLPDTPEKPTSPPVIPPSEPDDEPDTPTPPVVEPPVVEPPVVEPPVVEPPVVDPETPDDKDKKDKPKGDNSDANGKGGNKHDRDDFTHGGTETAEDKKDD